MRKGFSVVSFCLSFGLTMIPASGQTAAQVSSLIKKSKLVDTNRDVNAVVGPSLTTISTFCHPKASEQDLKITALLMMKELRLHYKSIKHMRAVFFDPGSVQHYREVEIRDNDVQQVDQGKPVAEVLSLIAVRSHTMPATRTGSVASAGYGQSNSISDFATYKSADGEVSMQYPKAWTSYLEAQGLTLMHSFYANRNGSSSVLLTLYRYSFPLQPSVELLLNAHENEMQLKLKNFKIQVHRQQDSNGFPGYYSEVSGVSNNGAQSAERSIWIRNQKTVYAIVLYSNGMPDSEMNHLFQKVSSSLRISSK